MNINFFAILYKQTQIKIHNIENKILVFIKNIKSLLRNKHQFLSNGLTPWWDGLSDEERWSKKQSLNPSWDERTKKMSALIPSGMAVIEFGAGRLALKKFLPDGCKYSPSDIVDRGSGTVVCDLNGEKLPTFKRYDVAFFSGVLEYINDVPRLIENLSNSVYIIIASYAVNEYCKYNRKSVGWVNNYTSAEFLAIFRRYGFNAVSMEKWDDQLIVKFNKTNT